MNATSSSATLECQSPGQVLCQLCPLAPTLSYWDPLGTSAPPTSPSPNNAALFPALALATCSRLHCLLAGMFHAACGRLRQFKLQCLRSQCSQRRRLEACSLEGGVQVVVKSELCQCACAKLLSPPELSRTTKSCKGSSSGLYLLHIPQLILDRVAVATAKAVSPCHDRTIT